MAEPSYIPQRVIELMALPFGAFAQTTQAVNPKPCILGFDPEMLLLQHSEWTDIVTNQLLPQLEQHYRNGREIFEGWIDLALQQWKLESPDEFEAWPTPNPGNHTNSSSKKL